MITKKELTDVLGLSCVERYFAAWFAKFGDITKLYADSFVSIRQVFDDFYHGATYQNYCYVPRLQDTAEAYGMVTHRYIPCPIRESVELLKSASPNALCLVRVNTAFFTDFKRSSWREDHYVCVQPDMKWINEYPLSEGRFTEERFAEIYDGAVCIYECADMDALPEDIVTRGICTQNIEGDMKIPHTLADIESAVGVLRITRKRWEKFYGQHERVKTILHTENKLLDKIYFSVRLRRIQHVNGEKIDVEKTRREICGWIREAVLTEKKVKEAVENGARGY